MLIRYCDKCKAIIPESTAELPIMADQNLIRVDISTYANDSNELFPRRQGDGWRLASFLLCRECARKILESLGKTPSWQACDSLGRFKDVLQEQKKIEK